LLLQKKGYAVLYINGVPANMRNEKYLTKATHMGGYVYQRSALAAYKYVTEKYNLAKDGCFIIGRSMGGVTSLNLAMSGAIPVKALALDAPVIDAFHDAYFDGYWANGTLGGRTAAIFPWIQQWRYCDFTNDTYTIPIGEYKVFGSTYNVSVEEVKPLANLYNSTQDMAILWHLNSDIQCGYNAYKTGDFLVKNLDDAHVYNTSTDNDDEYYGKKLLCPCKIWFGSGDTVNQPSIAERFVRKCRNGGSIAVLRTVPTNDHAVWGITQSPDGASISVVEDGITCSPYGVELWQWIKRWDN
jgi:pimeloyl-ACP methyl ester carboxylesterase